MRDPRSILKVSAAADRVSLTQRGEQYLRELDHRRARLERVQPNVRQKGRGRS